MYLLQLSLLLGGDNVLLHLYGSEGDVLEDTLQKSLCTSVEEARDSYEDWVLICLLSKNGSPYCFFSFVCFFTNASFLLSQDLRVAARWVDRITDMQP